MVPKVSFIRKFHCTSVIMLIWHIRTYMYVYMKLEEVVVLISVAVTCYSLYVCRVNENFEQILFREKFADWPEPGQDCKVQGT